MLAVQLNLCVGAATAAYHSITSVPHIHKMCRHGRHTFVFHAPEGRASYSFAVLHVPKARLICGAAAKKAPRRALFVYYILSGTVMLSTVSTFLIVFFAARQRVIRASISKQSSQRQRQAL